VPEIIGKGAIRFIGDEDCHMPAAIPAGMAEFFRTITGGFRYATTTGYQL